VEENNTRWTLLALLGSLGGFVVFVVIIWGAGFLNVTGADPNSKVVAAALALVGAFFGSAVTLTGILLKHSIDIRSGALALEAEKRLKLEAAMKAIQLFTTNKGDPAPAIQITGALFGLSSLGQIDLTLALARQLIVAGILAPDAVSHLMDQALQARDQAIRETAVNILVSYPDSVLVPPGSACVPDSLCNGVANQQPYVKGWAAIVLGSVIAARPPKKWEFRELAYLVASLVLVWQQQTDEDNKRDSAAILKQVLLAMSGYDSIEHPVKTVDLEEIRRTLASSDGKPTGSCASELVERLRKWVDA